MAETPKFEGLLQRVRSALILLPFVIALVVFGGWSFTLLLAIAGFLMAREWAGLIAAPQSEGNVLGAATVALLGYGLFVSPLEAVALLWVAALAMAAFCFAQGRRLGPVVGGLFYVALPLLAAQFLRQEALGMFLIGYILISVWAVDIFAMFAGKIIGGPKLAPVISPKKLGPVSLAVWWVRRWPVFCLSSPLSAMAGARCRLRPFSLSRRCWRFARKPPIFLNRRLSGASMLKTPAPLFPAMAVCSTASMA